MGVIPTNAVKAGEELFTHYGYEHQYFEVPNDFPWYWELKRNMEKEARLERKFNTAA